MKVNLAKLVLNTNSIETKTYSLLEDNMINNVVHVTYYFSKFMTP